DLPAHRRVEDPAAGDLETGEARAVEDLRDPKDLRGRKMARKGLLREEADRRVDELWHESWTLATGRERRRHRFGSRQRSSTARWPRRAPKATSPPPVPMSIAASSLSPMCRRVSATARAKPEYHASVPTAT